MIFPFRKPWKVRGQIGEMNSSLSGGFLFSDRWFQLEFLFLVDTRECRELRGLWKLENWGRSYRDQALSDAVCCAHCVWNGLSFSSPPRSLLSFRAAFLAFVCADERDKSDIKTPSECVSLKVSIFLALFPMSFHFHCNFEKRGATVVRRGAVWRRDADWAETHKSTATEF